MNAREVIVNIHGRDYKISSFQDPEYTLKLAEHCEKIMSSIETSSGSSDYIRLLVLTLLQVTSDYFQELESAGKPQAELDAQFLKVIKALEKTEEEVAKIPSSHPAGGASR